MAKSYYSGKFYPRVPSKYKGKVNEITYRSSWELQFMKYLDENPNVISWNSEEVIIPYISPKDNRPHRYFMDFWFASKTSDGSVKQFLVEIKPYNQTKPPIPKKRVTQSFKNAVDTYGVNIAKWEAAAAYANSRGFIFKVLTEKTFNFL